VVQKPAGRGNRQRPFRPERRYGKDVVKDSKREIVRPIGDRIAGVIRQLPLKVDDIRDGGRLGRDLSRKGQSRNRQRRRKNRYAFHRSSFWFEMLFAWLKDNQPKRAGSRKNGRTPAPKNLASAALAAYIFEAGFSEKRIRTGRLPGLEAGRHIKDSRAKKGSAGYGCVWTKEKEKKPTT
jgi:hypothetical protein